MLLFLFIIYFFQIETVTVHITDASTAFSAFEKDLIKDVFHLYQLKYGKKINIKWKYEKDFGDLFKIEGQNSISINAITITDERKRKYLFSHPYFPVKQAIITTTENGLFDWKRPGTRICIEKTSIHSKTAIKLSKRYNLKPVPLKPEGTYSNQIKENVFDICISDVTTCWDETNNLIVLDSDHDLLEISNYGILYPKKSALKDELDRILRYYLKSPSYYNIIRKHFGSIAVKYIRSFK